MDKRLTTLLYVLLGVTLFGVIFNIFSVNRNLQQSLKLIQESQEQLADAQKEIRASKAQLDSLRLQLKFYQGFLYDIKERVQILDLERRNNDKEFQRSKERINVILDSLYNKRGLNEVIAPLKEFKEQRNN
jgi:chromosome segregation ATPase